MVEDGAVAGSVLEAVDRLAGLPAGPALAAAIAGFDFAQLSGLELAGLVQAQARQAAHEQALLLRMVTRMGGQASSTRYGEQEVACLLTWSRNRASRAISTGAYLSRALPRVLDAFTAGVIDTGKAGVFADQLGTLPDATAAALAAQVLPDASHLTAGQLRYRLRKLALQANPEEAARRREHAIAQRRVILDKQPDGTADLSAIGLPAERAAACFERIDALARGRRYAGHDGDLDQLRADVLLDLLEGVDAGAVPVARQGVIDLTVSLETLAALADTPGLLGRYGPIGADVARQLADAHHDYLWLFQVRGGDGTLLATGNTRARPEPPPAPLVPDQDSDARLPNAAMRRWITLRDVTCRFPGCPIAARRCEVDHTHDYAAGGRTIHDNLAALCPTHHKTKHEGGWQVKQPRPGHFTWTSPTCHIYEVYPEPP